MHAKKDEGQHAPDSSGSGSEDSGWFAFYGNRHRGLISSRIHQRNQLCRYSNLSMNLSFSELALLKKKYPSIRLTRSIFHPFSFLLLSIPITYMAFRELELNESTILSTQKTNLRPCSNPRVLGWGIATVIEWAIVDRPTIKLPNLQQSKNQTRNSTV